MMFPDRLVFSTGLLLASWWAAALPTVAQSQRFEHLGPDEGLSNETVVDIAEDPQGYLWIATNLGLNRYDGYTFKRYLPDPEDSTSITDNFLRDLLVDRQSRVWIGTADDGVLRLDPGSDRFVRYPEFGFTLLEDSDGTLWFNGRSPGGLARLDPSTEEVIWYAHDSDDPGSLGANFALAAYQDRQGTLWIGTAGGLDRFDPQTETFTHYVHDPNDEHTLASNVVLELLEDSRGTFWVGTLGDGLHTMDRETGTFTRYPSDPRNPAQLSRPFFGSDPNLGRLMDIHEDREGVLWFAAIQGGLVRYDPATETVTRFVQDPDDPRGLWSNDVSSICETVDGTLWVGTYVALHRMVAAPPGVHHEPFQVSDPENPDAGVWTVLESRDGTLWWGTSDGLVRKDPENGAVVRFRHDSLDRSSLGASGVTALLEDRERSLWVGTLGGGLARRDPESKTTGSGARQGFVRYRHDPDNERSLTDDYVRQLFEDRHGTLWVLTFGGGLHRIDSAEGTVERVFAPRAYTPSTFERLDELDRQNRSLAALLEIKPAEMRGQQIEIYESTPVLLVHQAILWWNGRLNDYSNYFGPAAKESLYGGGWLRNRIEIRIDTLAPGSYTASYQSFTPFYGYGNWYGMPPDHPERWGVQVYSLKGRELPEIQTIDRPKRGLEGALFVSSIVEDAAGSLWAGTDEGFFRLDRTTDRFVLDPEKPRIDVPEYQVLVDREDVWWIGTAMRSRGGNLLFRFDPATGSRRQITGIGLPNESIYGLVEDRTGRIWVRSSSGLGVFDGRSQSVRPFDTGMTWSRSPFGAAHPSRSGQLYFSRRDGVTVIDPDRSFDMTPPRVVLTSLRVMGEPVESGTAVSSEEAPMIRLAHDRNELTFEYVGISYRHAAETRYAYRLEGFDDTYRDAGTERKATYTNLPPGEYTFHVKAANADGVWNEDGATLRVTILPPWWRTWWAYGLYVLGFVGGVFTVDRVQRRRLIARQREMARRRELEQAREIEQAYHRLEETHRDLKATQQQLVQQEKMASLGALTAGIAHEIKNPLNFINNFAEVNEELLGEIRDGLKADPELRVADIQEVVDVLGQNVKAINHHGRRADSIVHAMMQHASGGKGRREATDLNALVEEHVNLAYHGRRAQAVDFIVEIERDPDERLGLVDVVPSEIARVVLNLLGNAFDAVQEHALRIGSSYRPTVTVATRRLGTSVEIRVSDNGPGIPAEIREKIFEPFFTTKPTGSGTGLGLSLSHEIVTQGHGGSLRVEDRENGGSTFVVTLPVSHPATADTA